MTRARGEIADLIEDGIRMISLLNSTLSLAHELVQSLTITSQPSPSLVKPIKRNLNSIGPAIERLILDKQLLDRECRQARVSLAEVRRKEDELSEIKTAWDRICTVLSGRPEIRYIVDELQTLYPSLFAETDRSVTKMTPMIPYHDEPEASSHRMAESTKIGTLNEETLQSQNRQVLKQDAQLDLLSASIGRQHHLSLQMNEELDTQAALLDDVDNHLDGTQVRLQSASRRLDRFASSIREQGSTWTIFGLIIVLIMLIVIFK